MKNKSKYSKIEKSDEFINSLNESDNDIDYKDSYLVNKLVNISSFSMIISIILGIIYMIINYSYCGFFSIIYLITFIILGWIVKIFSLVLSKVLLKEIKIDGKEL
ncbi:hypothetical protein [uncultured Clostridium sp.]|uniref:hypothetical protein n=1 Tax=uncultured Clostridium sp. TaxID=59620 RepID=UPI002614D2DC|nr:hypothetical protein [uncultured Clostridium sp.]